MPPIRKLQIPHELPKVRACLLGEFARIPAREEVLPRMTLAEVVTRVSDIELERAHWAKGKEPATHIIIRFYYSRFHPAFFITPQSARR